MLPVKLQACSMKPNVNFALICVASIAVMIAASCVSKGFSTSRTVLSDEIGKVMTKVWELESIRDQSTQKAGGTNYDAILEFSRALHEIDTTHCPGDFRKAFEGVVYAWKRYADAIRQDIAIMHSALGGVSKEMLKRSNRCQIAIDNNWERVWYIATKYQHQLRRADPSVRRPSSALNHVYAAMRISDVSIMRERFMIGENVSVEYCLTNTSGRDLDIPVNTEFSERFFLVGVQQYWVERLGNDPVIASMPLRISRDGRRYAAGGSIITSKRLITAGDQLYLYSQLDTKEYPPGNYRYYIEYKKLNNVHAVIQCEHVDFQLVRDSRFVAPLVRTEDAPRDRALELGLGPLRDVQIAPVIPVVPSAITASNSTCAQEQRRVSVSSQEYISTLEKSANQGNVDDQFNLGVMYERGQGVLKDYKKAVDWYAKAAAQGNAMAQCNLGLIYVNGKAGAPDYVKGFEWLRKAAEQGAAIAQENLGVMYARGDGRPKDCGKALEWYSKAADQGNAEAQNNIGLMYAHGNAAVEKDEKKAFEWYSRAAKQGSALAQHNLGFMYEKGLGVCQDYSKAIECYERAAEQGVAASFYNLGVIYNGGRAVTQNISKVVGLLTKAAALGHAKAQHDLGVMYERGIGVSQDFRVAFDLFLKAAEQGLGPSQCNLGVMYAAGQGVPRDFRKAYVWFRIAEKNGMSKAGAAREDVVCQLTHKELMEARDELVKQVELIQKAKASRPMTMPALSEP